MGARRLSRGLGAALVLGVTSSWGPHVCSSHEQHPMPSLGASWVWPQPKLTRGWNCLSVRIWGWKSLCTYLFL